MEVADFVPLDTFHVYTEILTNEVVKEGGGELDSASLGVRSAEHVADLYAGLRGHAGGGVVEQGGGAEAEDKDREPDAEVGEPCHPNRDDLIIRAEGLGGKEDGGEKSPRQHVVQHVGEGIEEESKEEPKAFHIWRE